MTAPDRRVECFFVEGPRFDAYRALIDVLTDCSERVLLVARQQLKLSPRAQAVLDELSPFVAEEVRGNEWPGTQLLGHYARIR